MDKRLVALAHGSGGVVTRRQALTLVPPHVWSYALRRGHLVAAFPGVAVLPARAGEPATRWRAALACAGSGAALSHTSALAVWQLPVRPEPVVHLTTGTRRRLRVPGIVAHRRAGFRPEPPQMVVRAGLPVTRLEQSLVDAWPLAVADAQRAPLLRAVGDRMTTPQRVAAALRAAPNLPGRAGLRSLIDKLDLGCRSELELWGHDHVFTGSEMPAFRWQMPVALGRRTVYLDLYHPETRTNIELDGSRYHTSPEQRDRDLRRDAALAALGILVVRFTHDRLVHEPGAVRAEVLAIPAARRVQLYGSPPGTGSELSIGHFG